MADNMSHNGTRLSKHRFRANPHKASLATLFDLDSLASIFDGKLLVHGDNVAALNLLKEFPKISGKVRLVYIDPPFSTGQKFIVSDNRFSTISRPRNGKLAYQDCFTIDEYLNFLRIRLILMRDLMAHDGSIYVHIDYKVGHYVKCLMDTIFGREHFISDITRIKCNPKNFSRAGYGNIKDMVLFYSKSSRYVWNDLRQCINLSNDTRFRSVDSSGRRYATTPLHAPGETANGNTGKSWRGMSPPPGRHWRCSPNVLDALDKKGLIEWSSTGNPRKKLYADEVEKAGTKIQDVWTFKDPQHPQYPTEKNLEMLKMVVANSSKLGDIVLDAFCGSGATLVAAEELGRKWIGIDSSPVSISICRERLKETGCDFVKVAD